MAGISGDRAETASNRGPRLQIPDIYDGLGGPCSSPLLFTAPCYGRLEIYTLAQPLRGPPLWWICSPDAPPWNPPLVIYLIPDITYLHTYVTIMELVNTAIKYSYSLLMLFRKEKAGLQPLPSLRSRNRYTKRKFNKNLNEQSYNDTTVGWVDDFFWLEKFILIRGKHCILTCDHKRKIHIFNKKQT